MIKPVPRSSYSELLSKVCTRLQKQATIGGLKYKIYSGLMVKLADCLMKICHRLDGDLKVKNAPCVALECG